MKHGKLVILFQEGNWAIVNGYLDRRDFIAHVPCMKLKKFDPDHCFPAVSYSNEYFDFNLDYSCTFCKKRSSARIKSKIAKAMALMYTKRYEHF